MGFDRFSSYKVMAAESSKAKKGGVDGEELLRKLKFSEVE